jgi:hypothetical protein
MKTNHRSSWYFLLSLFFTGLLTACANMGSHEADRTEPIIQAERDVRTPAEHAALAKHFEESAKELQSKANEQKKLLLHYKSKHYLYGWEPHDVEAHTQALILQYEQAAKTCMAVAVSHRKMASEARELE